MRRLVLEQLVQLVARAAVADQVAVDGQLAGVDLLGVVDAAQERRLPEPDGPGMHVTLPRRTCRSMPLSTSSGPNRLQTASDRILGVRWATGRAAVSAIRVLLSL